VNSIGGSSSSSVVARQAVKNIWCPWEPSAVSERQLREIGKLPPERWSSTWEEALITAPPKGVTTVAKKTKSELALISVRDSELTPSKTVSLPYSPGLRVATGFQLIVPGQPISISAGMAVGVG